MKKERRLVMVPTKNAVHASLFQENFGDKKLFQSFGNLQQFRDCTPMHFYAIDDQPIPHKGLCNSVCLSELEAGYPEYALVKSVGNCYSCREIITSSDILMTDTKYIDETSVDDIINYFNKHKKLPTVELDYINEDYIKLKTRTNGSVYLNIKQ